MNFGHVVAAWLPFFKKGFWLKYMVVDLYEMKSEEMTAFERTSERSAVRVNGGKVNRVEKALRKGWSNIVCCDHNLQFIQCWDCSRHYRDYFQFESIVAALTLHWPQQLSAWTLTSVLIPLKEHNFMYWMYFIEIPTLQCCARNVISFSVLFYSTLVRNDYKFWHNECELLMSAAKLTCAWQTCQEPQWCILSACQHYIIGP